jgi:hypothetical protein
MKDRINQAGEPRWRISYGGDPLDSLICYAGRPQALDLLDGLANNFRRMGARVAIYELPDGGRDVVVGTADGELIRRWAARPAHGEVPR